MTRKYTKLKQYSKLIEELHMQGKTQREIAEKLEVTKKQVEWYFTRKHIREQKTAMGIVPRPKGRPPKEHIVTEQDKSLMIAAQKYAKEFTVKELCEYFKVFRSGYYSWIKTLLNRRQRDQRDQVLAVVIRECQKKSDKTYGYPAIGPNS